MQKKVVIKGIVIQLCLITLACSSSDKKRAAFLYESQCASCHLLPEIDELPKDIWETGVLPNMAARMGIRHSTNDPYRNLTYSEKYAVIQTGVFPNIPMLPLEDWDLIKNYIISLAPDSLNPNLIDSSSEELFQFVPKPVNLDSSQGTFITFLKFDARDGSIISGDLKGNLLKYDRVNDKSRIIARTGNAITNYSEKDDFNYITHVGYLNPSEIANGNIHIRGKNTTYQIPFVFHRPVHTLIHDMNMDGYDEIVVSEFGDLTGSLSLVYKKDGLPYKKDILLNLPGTIRVLAKDMNGDKRDDLIALTSQGQESITILYQQADLKFVADPVIRFSPVFGTSWFELVDYDGDGDEDIITVNGDNADKSYVQKPYHGMRIYINNGENKFEENYFYPLNGATSVVSRDFDKDGDLDFGILATFPDYAKNPLGSFVYLENKNSETFHFTPYTFQDSKLGRWLLMDAGDVDKDGDEDIILSSFTYSLTPVPEAISDSWKASNVDLMILQNTLLNLDTISTNIK